MNREYIRVKKPSLSFPKNTDYLKALDDEFWKKWVFYHLLSFYKSYDSEDLKEKIEQEKKKKKSDIEDLIAIYIREHLRKDRLFGLQGLKVMGGVNNDLAIKGLYDISIMHSYWDKEFHFECKNLDGSQGLTDKYVCSNTYKKDSKGQNIFDGGVLRYFNGKYAQSLNFGGMIGFILTGDSNTIKSEILKKLNGKFPVSPEGDLISTKDDSIEDNSFTFDSLHSRQKTKFTIHHLLFDFVK